jgi:hypothetical protein
MKNINEMKGFIFLYIFLFTGAYIIFLAASIKNYINKFINNFQCV